MCPLTPHFLKGNETNETLPSQKKQAQTDGQRDELMLPAAAVAGELERTRGLFNPRETVKNVSFVVICFNTQQNYGRHYLDGTKSIASMFTCVCCLVSWLIVATRGLYSGSVSILKVGRYEGSTTLKQKKRWGHRFTAAD